MRPRTLKLILISSIVGLFLGWIALMVSFWLPIEFARNALSATALCLLIPSGVAAAVISVCWEELQDLSFPTKQPKMRCIDCGSKILNAAGTTIGDEMEGELMAWSPRTDPRHPHEGPMG